VASAAAALWSSAALPPLLTSFQPAALQGAREAAPQLPRALLLDTLRPGWLDEAQALGCAGVVTNHAVLDAASLAAIHGAGMRGLVYTVNDPAEARRLDALGIDGIVTDAVDRFSPGEGSRRLAFRRGDARPPAPSAPRRRARAHKFACCAARRPASRSRSAAALRA
jgi:glycerophosphoryl diester phosphodiesterase